MSFFGIVGLFSLSFLLGLLTIEMARRWNLGADNRPGIQRMHSHWVPRLGGVPIYVGLSLWMILAQWELPPADFPGLTWAMCLLPAFAVGLAEDLTHKLGAWPRLIATMIGAGIAWVALDIQIVRLGLPVLDSVLSTTPWLSLAVTMLFVGGGAHAINIIDGYNGLASAFAMIVLFAVLVVAGFVQDFELMYITVGAIAATLGFFVLNFPKGQMFLGDSGAYLLGTIVGFVLAVLVARHPVVSPMFAAVLMVYPVWELLFSSYRRRVIRNLPAMQPDAIHLHTLVHKRLVRMGGRKSTAQRRILMNSQTTLYMLAGVVTTAALAVLAWKSTWAELAIFCSFIVAYLFGYNSLVRFRAQRRLSVTRLGRHWPRGRAAMERTRT